MSHFQNPDELKFDPERVRLPALDDPRVIEMANSIKEIGQLQAVLIGEDNIITDGFTRSQACKRLGIDVGGNSETLPTCQ